MGGIDTFLNRVFTFFSVDFLRAFIKKDPS